MPLFGNHTTRRRDIGSTHPQVDDGFGSLATRCLQVVIVLVIAIGIVYAAATLSVVTIPVLLALIIASAMHPVVSWLRRHKVPSVLATLAVLLGVLVVLGLVGCSSSSP